MAKKVIFGKELHEKAKESINLMSKSVGATLGPSGRLGLLDRGDVPSLITKDGVTVARNLLPQGDPAINLIATKIFEVANKTNSDVGDGCQDIETPILAPTGWMKMKDLEIGTEICGTNGTIQKVEAIFSKGKKRKNNITFSGGAKTHSCDDHIWTVTNSDGRTKDIKLKEMIKDYKKTSKDGNNRFKYYVQANVVQFKEDKSKMPIDPYFLGVLLGDGSLSGKGRDLIELSLGKAKEHVIDKLILPEGIKMNVNWVESKHYFRIKFTDVTPDGESLRKIMGSIGLLGTTSHTKFIPDSYLYSSIESRTKLLQGMIDTDGHINKRGLFEFSTVNKTLADNFADLCRGLGKQISIREKDRTNAGGYSKNNTFHVEERAGYKYGNKVIDIQPTDEFVEMMCIKVSNEDQLYITENYIVTHNTTTATVLANAIYEQAVKHLNLKPSRLSKFLGLKTNNDPIEMKKQIQETLAFILKELDAAATPVNTLKKMKEIAAISANNDRKIGDIVAEAISKVGQDGFVTVEESDQTESSFKVIEGMELSKGVHDIRYLDGNHSKSLENPYMLIVDGRIDDEQAITGIIDSYCQGRPLVIISEITEYVGKQLVHLNKAGVANVISIVPPMFKNARLKYLQDVACFVGAEVINPQIQSIITVRKEQLGGADKVIASYDKTNIIAGHGKVDEVIKRIDGLKEEMENSKSKYDRDIIKERIGKLSTGTAIISVGGTTEEAIKEAKDRFDDALNATRSAIEEGYVNGGGYELYRISKKIKGSNIGEAILKEAIKAPMRKIISNTGRDYKDIESKIDDENGYDAKNHIICNLSKSGIIDPVKVTKTALKNAVSIVELLINLEVLVYKEKELELPNLSNFGM